MTIDNLGNFPNTIANLEDKPNLAAQAMKEALQQDVKSLWNKVKTDVIPTLNNKEEALTKATTVNASSTDNEIPTAKATYDAISNAISQGAAIKPVVDSNGVLSFIISMEGK